MYYFIIKNIEQTDPVGWRREGTVRKSRFSSRNIVDGNKKTKTKIFAVRLNLITTTMACITIRSDHGRNLAGLVPPSPDDCR